MKMRDSAKAEETSPSIYQIYGEHMEASEPNMTAGELNPSGEGYPMRK